MHTIHMENQIMTWNLKNYTIEFEMRDETKTRSISLNVPDIAH